jgi:hypothetical protein
MRPPVSLLLAVAAAACSSTGPGRAPSPETSLTSPYAGKTVLFYDGGHGNQIEYYDPAGRAFLWYPGNAGAVRGRWRTTTEAICFLYGPNTYNPVTGQHGGSWECTPWDPYRRHITDVADGDVFELSTGAVPYRLQARPRFGSISEVVCARSHGGDPCGNGGGR